MTHDQHNDNKNIDPRHDGQAPDGMRGDFSEQELFEAKLTAYALGELDGSDRADVEARIATDADAALHVEEVRATAAALTQEFAAEPAVGLTDDQRASLERKLPDNPAEAPAASPKLEIAGSQADNQPTGGTAMTTTINTRRFRLMALGGVGLAAAASLALMVTVGPWSVSERDLGKDKVAMNDESADFGDDAAAPETETSALRTGRGHIAAQDDGGSAGNLSQNWVAASPPAPGTAAPAKRARMRSAGGTVAGGGGSGMMRRRPKDPNRPKRTAGGAGIPGVTGGWLNETEAEADRSGRMDRFSPEDRENFNTEAYDRIIENEFKRILDEPLSTFSIDVDTAAYADVRRYLNGGRLPRPDAVRIEEMINYFTYDYPAPSGETPFSVNTELGACPWNEDHYLVRIGLKGRTIPADTRPATNLVFLLDVSGSMNQGNKLPLVKDAMKMLVNNLTVDDRISIVVYAGAAGTVLPPTYCSDRPKILEALDQLQAGGSTHGSAGIQLAYELAEKSFIKGGVNRVILCTDGDLNVGVTADGDLERLIEKKRETGVFLSVLAFGTGNTKFSKMEKLADKGNGNYAYIDSINEARKVLVEEMGGTLVTIAKDVKFQIEFNPAKLTGYRLIGYENRMLRAQDFNDDTKDAGEIGAGHTVTALYEIVPVGVELPAPDIDDLKYQQGEDIEKGTGLSDELLTVKLRYKQPDGDVSTKVEFPLKDTTKALDEKEVEASEDFNFAAAVASFGMVLRDSKFKGDATFDTVIELGRRGKGDDTLGYRTELLNLVQKAKELTAKGTED